MYIASQSSTELVVEDSTVWLSWIFGVCAAVIMFFSVTQHQLRGLVGAALFVLFALIVELRTVFTFDATQRVVRWKSLKRFKTETGSISFDEIDDIGTESISGDSGSLTYRLTIITSTGTVPMAYSYSGHNDANAQLRHQILAFIKPGSEQETGVTAQGIQTDLEPSLRSLLDQGRKIDAIKLLQSSQNLGLSDAVKRVELLEQSMKARA